MTKLGMVINLSRCVGCHTCANACKMSNDVPMNMLWNRILTDGSDVLDGAAGTYPDLKRTYIPLACQHCENPACRKVCPTSATHTDEKGRVEIDYAKCIGCRYCMAACPYNVRVFNWSVPNHEPDFKSGYNSVPERQKGVMEKCTLCKERCDDGLQPMCVECCPTSARVYGDLDDPNSEISKLITAHKAYNLLEGQGTRPQVYYYD